MQWFVDRDEGHSGVEIEGWDGVIMKCIDWAGAGWCVGCEEIISGLLQGLSFDLRGGCWE